jgi:outer membrane protein
MKKLISTTIIIFFSFFCIVNAELNIAFIDMDKIISTSKPGSSIFKQLSLINKKNFEYFKNEEKKIKNKETKIIKQKNIISETEFKKNIEELKLEINNYNKKKTKIIDDFDKLKIDNTNYLLKKISSILKKFSTEKSISIILQKKNLVIGKTEFDITDNIIKIVDNEIEEFKIK